MEGSCAIALSDSGGNRQLSDRESSKTHHQQNNDNAGLLKTSNFFQKILLAIHRELLQIDDVYPQPRSFSLEALRFATQAEVVNILQKTFEKICQVWAL